MADKQTMKAVVFDGLRKVSVQDRPIPKVRNGHEIVVKVTATALCGSIASIGSLVCVQSDLHVYRGLEPSQPGYVMGHEFTGIVVEAGEDIKNIQLGDQVVVPFTISCMECFYCKHGWTSRCESSLLLGSPNLDGAQAEYVRVPHADGTAIKAPSGVPKETLVLMADIFPTGFFGAKNAFKLMDQIDSKEATVVVMGCGPVGLCAIICALEYKPKQIIAVDGVDSRLEVAKSLGAIPLNYTKEGINLSQFVLEATEGRGADAVIEVVGAKQALRTAYDIIRPWGVISSIGVHNSEAGFSKNLKVQMGRCPVRAVFPEALEVLAKNHQKLRFMFDKLMPLTQAVEAYDLFDKMQVQKVIFKPNE
ncbi:unnamed protein product [Clonostachys chloroleuca]|uniref:Enoyl reductase (ER) domain-containing protein n=1 Tax=Clonostachys chloroleuca TaxID=1926264 RepID=A0AA35Q7U2_9HYPO|nr:unnamed protein product [Clonostachys chloroleuca]